MNDEQDLNEPDQDPEGSSATAAEELRERVRAAERNGLEALETGDFAAASEFLLEAVGGYEELGDPKSTNSAAYYLGVSLAEQGKISQALLIWEEVVDRGLDSPSAFTRLIRHYESQNDATQVQRLFDRLGKAANERTGEFFSAIDESRGARRQGEALAHRADPVARPRALVADDEQTMLAILERALTTVGCDVLKAQDGSEALNSILRSRFDLIILDVFMPGPTGLDVLYRIRAEGIKTPVIVISGRGDEQMVLDAQQLGADWLAKPFDIDVLQDMAMRALQGESASGP